MKPKFLNVTVPVVGTQFSCQLVSKVVWMGQKDRQSRRVLRRAYVCYHARDDEMELLQWLAKKLTFVISGRTLYFAPVVLLYYSGEQHLSLSCLLPLTNFEEAYENVALLLSVTNDLKT